MVMTLSQQHIKMVLLKTVQQIYQEIIQDILTQHLKMKAEHMDMIYMQQTVILQIIQMQKIYGVEEMLLTTIARIT